MDFNIGRMKKRIKSIKKQMIEKTPVQALFFFLYFVVFSFSTQAQNVNHWEMGVTASDTWRYFPGTSEPNANWNTIGFDTSSWSIGPGGIGYGDGDDGTIIANVPSVYLRRVFNIVDVDKIAQLILDIDYDDAFVAYINGEEIARANIDGKKPSYSTYANNYIEAQMYSGGLPQRYILPESIIEEHLLTGNNVLAIQVHNYNATSSDLSSNAFLFLGINDNSSNYRALPTWFESPFAFASHLPLLIIETYGKTIPDEPKIHASLKVVDHQDGEMNNYLDEATTQYTNIGIETRGQSSLYFFPKKSYGFELRDDAGEGINDTLLGLPKEEDWVLYAPYSDKTMLRNAITYQLGRKIGSWQPRFKYCEVYLNGDYQGIYLLLEKIKRDKNRVDISKLRTDEIAGDSLTGGYIVKVDKIQDLSQNEYFYTYPTIRYPNTRNYAFTYVYPKADNIVWEQKNYINDFLAEAETSLNGSDFTNPTTGYAKYFDVNSFVEFQIMNEFANNVDGYRFSTYFHKQKDSKGGKLFAGPLWDFNLGYGNVDYAPDNLSTSQWLYNKYGSGDWQPMHWWARLMEDPNYQEALYQRWTELRSGPLSNDSILADMQEMIDHLGTAIDRNYDKWPIIGEYVWPNFDYQNTSYSQEYEFLAKWMIFRLEWMDNQITSTTGLFDRNQSIRELSVYPNPVRDRLNIRFELNSTSSLEINLFDVLGKLVYQSSNEPMSVGLQNIALNLPQLKAGYYTLSIQQSNQIIGRQKVIVNP